VCLDERVHNEANKLPANASAQFHFEGWFVIAGVELGERRYSNNNATSEGAFIFSLWPPRFWHCLLIERDF